MDVEAHLGLFLMLNHVLLGALTAHLLPALLRNVSLIVLAGIVVLRYDLLLFASLLRAAHHFIIGTFVRGTES